jgi:predicted TIM-barrel fold metal-dependent hydrolase
MAGLTAIDMHALWIPAPLVEVLRKRNDPPAIKPTGDGHEYIDCEFPSLRLPDNFERLDLRIADMDRNGVIKGVLSLSTVYGIDRLPLEESLPLSRVFNDSISEICSRYPERFNGLAALPMASLETALAEFERAIQLPGIVGALLPGDGFLTVERANRFRPIFEKANQYAAVLLVHYGGMVDDPSAPRYETSDNSHARIGTLDMQARLSANMITFCMSNFLDAFPNATVISHNLGGNIAFEAERLDHRVLIDRPGDELPSDRIRRSRVLVDCNSFGACGIEQAVAVFGEDRIVFGSDGTDFGMKWSRDAIAAARISDSARKAILSDNAARAIARFGNRVAAAAG